MALPKEMADYEPYKQAMSVVKPVDSFEAFVHKFSPRLAFGISRKITSLVTRKPHDKYRNSADNIEVKDVMIENVPVRIYRPTNVTEHDKTPGIIFVHGGYWLIYNVEDYDQLMYTLANKTRSMVASIEYTLSPDCKFPTALEQVYSVSKSIVNNVNDYNVDRDRIAMCGDSTGGNMIAATVHRLAKEGLQIKWQCLINTPLQFIDLQLPSYQQNVPANHLNILTHSGLNRFLREYLKIPSLAESLYANNAHVDEKLKQAVADKGYLSWDYIPEQYRSAYTKPSNTTSTNNKSCDFDTSILFDEQVSPLLATDETLSKCPNTYLITTEFDTFRDDSYIYAGRLCKLGIQAIVKSYENGYHGALNFYQDDRYKFPKVLFNDFVEFLIKSL